VPVRGHTLVPGEPAILTEDEFDALLLWQEAGDLVGVATLGSCNRDISPKALRYLLGCPRLLVAYDVDAEAKKVQSDCSGCQRGCSESDRQWGRM
jgi:hypothetical protein